MKKKYRQLLFILFFTVSFAGYSQVGIGTDSPKGALDINSSEAGFVYPVVQLAGLNSQTIENPNGANLVAGTTVYNTAAVNDGSNSVYPGIYIWSGSEWMPQFNKNDYKLFKQEDSLRTKSDQGKQNIVFNANTFTPKYNGQYKIKLTLNYGGGETVTPDQNSQYVNFVAAAGEFDYTFNGKSSAFIIKAYSGKNYASSDLNGGSKQVYSNQYKQFTFTLVETLLADINYRFTLTFNQEDLPGIVNLGRYYGDGYSTLGLGYIDIEDSLECTVEINYIGN